MITIIDYGLGNLASILNMIKKVGGSAKLSSNSQDIDQATKLILPGVGHFAAGMQNLKASGLDTVLKKKTERDAVPLLGICLGMQLLTSHSEEGDVEGLGFIPARTRRFNFTPPHTLKVPHMGWSDVQPKNHPLFEGINETPRYYFVHSYYASCDSPENSIATCHYGQTFDCAIGKENIMGVQFHPEKSHRFGMQIFKNFISNF